jgi:phosphonate transport system permease protein
MSILAFVIAGVLAMVLIPLASSNISHDRVSGRGKWIRFAVFATTRGVFIFTRSVPELLWALVVLFVISPGILAGAVALAIHNVGVIGRLGADTVEDVSPAPIDALRSTGANTAQIYLHGVLPLVARQLLTFQLYRWEVIIRTTAVVGFVAASGLGYQMRLDLSFFRYANVGQLLFAYLLIVWSVDALSALARKSMK